MLELGKSPLITRFATPSLELQRSVLGQWRLVVAFVCARSVAGKFLSIASQFLQRLIFSNQAVKRPITRVGGKC
jgi:hypothetical protein